MEQELFYTRIGDYVVLVRVDVEVRRRPMMSLLVGALGALLFERLREEAGIAPIGQLLDA